MPGWLDKHLAPIAQQPDATRVAHPAVNSGSALDTLLTALQAIGGGVRTAATDPLGQTLQEATRFGQGQGQFALDVAHAVPTLAAAVRDPSKLRTPATENAGITAAMALAGMLKLPEGEMLNVEHYSPVEGLTKLDPRKAGTGRAGREALRGSRVPAIHVYDSGTGQIERDIASGNYRYTGQVPAKSIYDIARDPRGLVAKISDENGNYDATKLEALLAKTPGISGYRNSDRSASIIKLFKPLDVQPAAPLKLKGVTYGVPHPLNVEAAAQQMHDALTANKGFTFQVGENGLLQPVTKGYSVGAGGETGTTLTRGFAKTKPTHLSDWLRQNLEHFDSPGKLVGGWLDDAGNVVAEPITPTTSRAAAIRLGAQRNEQGVGDLAAYARGEDGFIPNPKYKSPTAPPIAN